MGWPPPIRESWLMTSSSRRPAESGCEGVAEADRSRPVGRADEGDGHVLRAEPLDELLVVGEARASLGQHRDQVHVEAEPEEGQGGDRRDDRRQQGPRVEDGVFHVGDRSVTAGG